MSSPTDPEQNRWQSREKFVDWFMAARRTVNRQVIRSALLGGAMMMLGVGMFALIIFFWNEKMIFGAVFCLVLGLGGLGLAIYRVTQTIRTTLCCPMCQALLKDEVMAVGTGRCGNCGGRFFPEEKSAEENVG
jgi:hypothetical protein